jgi:Bacterial Ig domain/RTX calcium-binding nonapeptide repeat (4 copies)
MAIIIGNNADNVLVGTASGDVITGANGNDQIDGGAGDDIIDGGNGNDTIAGGVGNDIIDGGNGNDTITGGAGTDIILGGNGNDTLDGGSGSDLVSGGNGNDLLIYRASENSGSIDLYDGSAGQDTLRLIVNQSQYNTVAFQADVARLQSLLSHGSASTILTSLNLAVTSIERLEVVVESTGNHAPTAHDDTAATQEDQAVTISAATLLANDTDPDAGDTRTLVSVQNAQNGTVVLDPSGNVVFTATQNFSGIASFSYTMRDAAGATSTATVLVSVAAVADAPTLSVANATGNEDTAIALSISPALIDNDGSEHLSALMVSAIPEGATLSDGAGGHTFTASAGNTSVDILGWTLSGLTVRPPANSDVDFTLTVTATSREGASGPTASTSANLTVTVNPVADAPSLSVANATGAEDTAIALSITPALTDTDGSEHLSALFVSAIPVGATLSDGTNTFTALAGQTSVDILGWTLSGLTVRPPANSDADFTLTVTTTSQEGGQRADRLDQRQSERDGQSRSRRTQPRHYAGHGRGGCRHSAHHYRDSHRPE